MQFSNYHSFGKTVWASGFRLGIANPSENDLIATERFFAGGSYSLRGFEKDSVGPKDAVFNEPQGGEAVWIINQEFRFPIPLHQWLHGVVFYDGGNVYRKLSDFDPTDLRHSLGMGVRLRTPFGAARFDVGFNLRPKEQEDRAVFHFGLGHAF